MKLLDIVSSKIKSRNDGNLAIHSSIEVDTMVGDFLIYSGGPPPWLT